MSKKQPTAMFISAICPSCRTNSKFKFIGVQEWHPEIARQLNVPARIRLYRCQTCDTCINEFALRDDSATAG